MKSVQNFLFYLYASSPCVETGVLRNKLLLPLYTKTVKKADRSLRISFVYEGGHVVRGSLA